MNALVQPYLAGVRQAVVCPLYDPLREHNLRERFRRPSLPRLSLANSLWVPSGCTPARAWVLVLREDYSKLNLYATDFQLQLNSVTFKGLSIVQAQCVSRGTAADSRAVYLVELTDARGLICNEWFAAPTASQYNVRAPAYPERFYDGTLNAGTPWTWDQMVGDLWNQMSTFLGAYPGLPSIPAGTPEDFRFVGTSAWQALCSILNHLGMTVACDLTSASPYSIVTLGAADTSFTAASAQYATLLEEDLEWIDTGSGRVPKTVTVYFRRRYQYYGTEETIRLDSFQWTTPSHYAVTIDTGFTSAAAPAFLWDDFTVRDDVDGSPLPADIATANAIAAERVIQYVNRIHRATAGCLTRVYTGVAPFKTGSVVDGVRWYFDYSQGRGGWRTEVIRGYLWPELRRDWGSLP